MDQFEVDLDWNPLLILKSNLKHQDPFILKTQKIPKMLGLKTLSKINPKKCYLKRLQFLLKMLISQDHLTKWKDQKYQSFLNLKNQRKVTINP